MAGDNMLKTLTNKVNALTGGNTKLAYGLAGLAALILVVGVYFALSSGGPSLADTVAVDIKDTDHVMGSADAPNTMVEYGSLTCTHCKRFNDEVLPKVVENYVKTGKVRYVFRDWPTDGYARMAAALAQCIAGDNYFSFVDLLFKNQAQWTLNYGQAGNLTIESGTDQLVTMARFAGLSREKAVSCINDPANLATVDNGQTEASKLYGVNSTPTFVINGKVYAGEQSYETLQSMFDHTGHKWFFGLF